MTTIKDIARRAGVSHGTVSNVLSKNGKASAEKIILVEKVAKELGYMPNAQASQLRAQTSNKIALIIPNIKMTRYQDFYISFANALKNTPYELVVFYTNDSVIKEKEVIRQAKIHDPIAIVVISSSKVLLPEHKFDNIIFFERKIEGTPCYKFDYFKAGAELAKQCTTYDSVGICCSCVHTNFDIEFFEGVKSIFNESNTKFTLFSENNGNNFFSAFDLATDINHFDIIITSNSQIATYTKRLLKYNNYSTPPKILTITSSDMLQDDDVIKYEMNYQYAANIIAQNILNKKKITVDKIFSNDGFASDYYIEKKKTEDSINFLILASPTAQILKKLLPEFTKRTGIKVRLIELPYEELYNEVKSNKDTKVYDIVRLDVVWMKSLAKELLLNLNNCDFPLDNILKKLPINTPSDYFYAGDGIYSIPFDTSVQIMYYRKDLFEDALIKRKYYESYKAQLSVPNNYSDFAQIAEFFTEQYNDSSLTKYGTAQVFGTPISAASDFLPYLTSENGITFDSNKFCLDEEIYTKALTNYINIKKYTSPKINGWWDQVLSQFISGEVAMCTVYSNHASRIIDKLDDNHTEKIGFCDVPFNTPLLGGGVIGISNSTKKIEQVTSFLNWLYSDEVANICTFMGGFISNQSIFKNRQLLDIQPWLNYMDQTFKSGSRRHLNLEKTAFDEYAFEIELGKAVRLVSQGLTNIKSSYNLINNYIEKVNKVK